MNPPHPFNPVQLFLMLLMSGSEQTHMPARERKDYIQRAQTSTTAKPAAALSAASHLSEVRRSPRPDGSPALSLKENMTERKVCQVKKKKICLSKHDISFPNQRKRDLMVRRGGRLIVS